MILGATLSGGDPIKMAKMLIGNEGDPPANSDSCEECLGRNGGVPGNENIIDGKTLCDVCTTHYLETRNEASSQTGNH
jgi:hypothetical protein